MNLINIAYAQSGDSDSAAGIINWFIDLINTALVPLVFALAFLLFLFGVFKFFFSTGADAEEKRREGKKFVIWAIIAFAIMICIWGLVNLLVQAVPELNKTTRPPLPCFSGTNCNSGGSSNTNSNSPAFGSDPATLNGPGNPVGM